MCALRGGSCAYINPSSALAGPACHGQADCARLQALNNAQDQARFLNNLCRAVVAKQELSCSREGQSLCRGVKLWF